MNLKKNNLWLTQRPIAHRGLHDRRQIPENSLAAFDVAIENNHPIECDVRMTADGELVVFHDANLERLTGDTRMIVDLSYVELNDLHLYKTKQKIPLLTDVLALIDRRVPILIEIKNNGSVGKIEKQVKELLENYHGKCAVQSFNPLTVMWFKKYVEAIPSGQILQCSPSRHVRITLKQWVLRMKWFINGQYPDFISYEDYCFPNHYFATLHKKRHIPILSWTIDSVEKREKVKKLSDNIIFERIDPLE